MEKRTPSIKEIINDGLRQVPETIGLAVADILATQRPTDAIRSQLPTAEQTGSQMAEATEHVMPVTQNKLEQ